VESVSLPTNRRLLRESDLIGAWPDGIAADELETGRLTALPIRLSQILGPVGVSTRAEGELSPAAEAFASALRDSAVAGSGERAVGDIA
jgi:LysR family pca operon transcriptional activator